MKGKAWSYEADFSENSFGFPPGRSRHDALRELSQTVEWEGSNYIAEVDIKGFFDNVGQDWMMKMLGHRMADQSAATGEANLKVRSDGAVTAKSQ